MTQSVKALGEDYLILRYATARRGQWLGWLIRVEAKRVSPAIDIQTIQAVLRSCSTNCEILGKQVDLNPNTGMFITMNPAGKGYGGHQKLPTTSNTDQSPSPDNEQIAEVILFRRVQVQTKASKTKYPDRCRVNTNCAKGYAQCKELQSGNMLSPSLCDATPSTKT
eukprot:Em0010g12a